MTSLIKFNQTVIQTVECVKYIFGLLSMKEDHLKQDIKFKRVYVITVSIILGLLRVYWKMEKVLHQLILPVKRIFSYGLEQLCPVPPQSLGLDPPCQTDGPSEQLIAAVGSWSRQLLLPSASYLSWPGAPLNNPMFTSHLTREETICLNCSEPPWCFC